MLVYTKEYQGQWQDGSLFLTVGLCWWQPCQQDTVEASLPITKTIPRWDFVTSVEFYLSLRRMRKWSKIFFLLFSSPLSSSPLPFLAVPPLAYSFAFFILLLHHCSLLCLLFQKKIEMCDFNLFSGRNTIKTDDSGFDLTFSFFF